MTNSKKAKRFQFWINVVLILITLSIILPFVLVFISSLTDENTLIRNGYSFFPEKFSFYAYSYIIRQGEKILRAYGITIFVTIVGTAANLAMSALLAYPLSIKKLPYRRAITFFVFFTMLFNGGLVPTYLMYVKYFHIKNTIWALIVPGFLLSANNVLMIRSYFNTSIPDALFEAAKIDGCNSIKTLWYVIVPMLKPSLVSCALFQFMWTSNDVQGPLIYISNMTKYTHSIYLRMSMDGDTGFQGNRILAMSLITIIPSLIVFFCAQNSFIDGIAAGGVKG